MWLQLSVLVLSIVALGLSISIYISARRMQREYEAMEMENHARGEMIRLLSKDILDRHIGRKP